jgi:hypothetical protein
MTLTPERLAKIRTREQSATEGPWRVEDDHVNLLRCVVSDNHELDVSLGYVGNRTEDDAVFVAHARQDVPDLLAEVDRLRNALTPLRTDASDIRGALSPNGEEARVPMPLGDTLLPAVEWLLAENERLNAEREAALTEAADRLRRDARALLRRSQGRTPHRHYQLSLQAFTLLRAANRITPDPAADIEMETLSAEFEALDAAEVPSEQP